MAHKKGAGSSKTVENLIQNDWVLKFHGQKVVPGNIIVRQRGTVHNPDNNVGMGKDHTLYALTEGVVHFKKKEIINLTFRNFKLNLPNQIY